MAGGWPPGKGLGSISSSVSGKARTCPRHGLRRGTLLGLHDFGEGRSFEVVQLEAWGAKRGDGGGESGRGWRQAGKIRRRRVLAATLRQPRPRPWVARNAAFPEARARVARRRALPPSTLALPLRARVLRPRGNAPPPQSSATFLQADAIRHEARSLPASTRRAWVPLIAPPQ